MLILNKSLYIPFYNISPTKATTFSGYTACMEPSQYSEVFPMYLDRLEILICKNNDGTYELRNTKNFDLVIDTKFSSQDIHITHT